MYDKKNLIGLIASIATVITAIGGLIIFLNEHDWFSDLFEKVDKPHFKEEFLDNRNDWLLEETDCHIYKILNKKLYVTSNQKGTCNIGWTNTWSNKISLKYFYPKYEINVTCDLISGNKDVPYGFILLNKDEFYKINYYSNGTTNLDYFKEMSIIESTSIQDSKSKSKVKLSLLISGSSYKYYVNKKFIEQGDFRFYDFSSIRLFASSTQTVEFEKVEITFSD